uniref:Uncharacterized protein n=1 Tax=Nelumbo nucifera TaxID=4432 RepID=A0A822XYQ2_NELNU|nr:TPA_asm: hypothetical protein HUJ06_026616 [Nelumbo nucifera]
MFEEESTGSSSMPEAIRPISNNSPSYAEEKKRRVHIDMNEIPKEDDNSDYSHEYERRGCEGEQEGTSTKRKKLKLTVQQIAVLEKSFKEDSLLTKVATPCR